MLFKGDMSSWVDQGVLCMVHNPFPDEEPGWTDFSNFVIQLVSMHRKFVPFVLLGNKIKFAAASIDHSKHLVLCDPCFISA